MGSGDDLMLNVRIEVNENSDLDGMTSDELKTVGPLSVLAHHPDGQDKPTLHPTQSFDIGAGDSLLICAVARLRHRLSELNARA